jgi:hypothetical protein
VSNAELLEELLVYTSRLQKTCEDLVAAGKRPSRRDFGLLLDRLRYDAADLKKAIDAFDGGFK